MASEAYPPSNRWILFFTVVGALGLVLLKPVLDSYFDKMVTGNEGARMELGRDLRVRDETRSSWDSALAGGSTNIDQAMAQIAQRGRNATPQLRGRAPDYDARGTYDAMQGWARRANTELPIQAERVFAGLPANAPPPIVIGAACGGIAGGECGSDQVCLDSADECDPATGGVDCPGTCQLITAAIIAVPAAMPAAAVVAPARVAPARIAPRPARAAAAHAAVAAPAPAAPAPAVVAPAPAVAAPEAAPAPAPEAE